MALQVFCNPSWRTLEAMAIQTWRRSDGKALVIVPSSMLRNWWLSRLAEEFGGIHGNSVVTLERFAERLAQGASQSLFRLARPLELRLAARDAFLACDIPETWRVNGVIETFLETVEELELHGLSPEDVAKVFPEDDNIKHLTELWQHWRNFLRERKLWTVGDVLHEGINAAKGMSDELPQEIIVYGFTALTELRWKFLQALQSKGVQTLKFFLPFFSGNEPAFRHTRELLDLLRGQGAQICESCDENLSDELKSIIRSAFLWQPEIETFKPTERIVCIAAAGEEQEVETAVRFLTQWRRENKLRCYSDALLLVRSLDKYLPALEAVSVKFGIPFSLLSENGEIVYGLQRLFNSVAEARRRGLNGEMLWQILPSPYLQIEGKPLLPAKSEDLKEVLKRIRENIVETDIEQWVQRLAGDEQFAPKLREFLRAIAELPMEAPAKDHARAWRKLLNDFIAPENDDEREAIGRVNEVLNSLMFWSTNLTLDEVIGLILDSCRSSRKVLSDSVKVASVVDGRGIWAPVVVLLGLNDDEFPKTLSKFELLSDEHRKKLSCSLGLITPLKFRHKFALAERTLFMEAIGSATERLVLAYCRTDPEGKPKASSVFLSAAENALKASGWQWHCEERDLGDVMPRNLKEAIDQRDAEKLAVFTAFTKDDPLTKEKALAARVLRNPVFHSQLLNEWQRWSKPQKGAWDGNVSALSCQIVDKLQTSGLRVTALEDYGNCPYKFFARHILNLQRPQDVTFTVDHRTIGTLWHEIMAKFLQEWQKSGDLPDEQVLRDIAQRLVNEKLANYPEMTRELVKGQICSAIPQVRMAENKEKQKGWIPIAAEKELNICASNFGNIPKVLHQVRISLKIDRIDEKANGQLRVADYKTGSAPVPSEIRNGIALQLPLYAHAVQISGEFEGKQVVEALFLKLLQFTQREKGYSTACHLAHQPKGRQQPLEEMKEIAFSWVKQFLTGIANADFTVRPFSLDKSCKNCDFKAMCRHSKLRLTERKHQGDSEEIWSD
ncbi:MAG: exodeoxyribonuclease V subunit gamma [Armatimonadetes bacterium]|nr:exodeoxyribonuclease V subunit gamma [Armatimonadota bacterium]